jgi:hypothetical protein
VRWPPRSVADRSGVLDVDHLLVDEHHEGHCHDDHHEHHHQAEAQADGAEDQCEDHEAGREAQPEATCAQARRSDLPRAQRGDRDPGGAGQGVRGVGDDPGLPSLG